MSGPQDDGAKKKRPRTAMVKLRAPFLYPEDGVVPKGGQTGLVDRVQLRAIAKAVKQARADGVLSVEDAGLELSEVSRGLEIIASGPHPDVGAVFPEGELFTPRRATKRTERRRRKAARKTRQAQRGKKKRRR